MRARAQTSRPGKEKEEKEAGKGAGAHRGDVLHGGTGQRVAERLEGGVAGRKDSEGGGGVAERGQQLCRVVSHQGHERREVGRGGGGVERRGARHVLLVVVLVLHDDVLVVVVLHLDVLINGGAGAVRARARHLAVRAGGLRSVRQGAGQEDAVDDVDDGLARLDVRRDDVSRGAGGGDGDGGTVEGHGEGLARERLELLAVREVCGKGGSGHDMRLEHLQPLLHE